MEIKFMTLDLHVEYTYIKEEEGTYYYPGAPAHIELRLVEHAGILINDFIDAADYHEAINDAVMDKLKEQEGEA
jgi:hypothetical protein